MIVILPFMQYTEVKDKYGFFMLTYGAIRSFKPELKHATALEF